MRRKREDKSPWSKAADGWRSICRFRAAQEAGNIVDPVKAARWSVFWRRQRLQVLVRSSFVCSRCMGSIDPDKPFSIVHKDPDGHATPGTPAEDLRALCYECRHKAEDKGGHDHQVEPVKGGDPE